MKGMKGFETRDELYTCLTGDYPIQVLAEAKSKIDGIRSPHSIYSMVIWVLGLIPVIAVFAFVFLLARSPSEDATSSHPDNEGGETAKIERSEIVWERSAAILPITSAAD